MGVILIMNDKKRAALKKLEVEWGKPKKVTAKGCLFFSSWHRNGWFITWREIYRLAACGSYWKKNLKHYHHRKNRNATRQILSQQTYEKFSRGMAKEEDKWGWT